LFDYLFAEDFLAQRFVIFFELLFRIVGVVVVGDGCFQLFLDFLD